MNRRNFMTSMAGFGALAAIPGLGSLRANAADDVAPRRLLLWYQPNGYGQDPVGVHARSLDTMAALRHKITYLRGMHLPSADGTHENNMERMLRGGSSGASFDQVIAEHLVDQTPHASLLLGVRSDQAGHGAYCSYTGDNDSSPLIDEPRNTWATIFANLDGGDDPEAQAAMETLWAERDLIMTRNQDAADSLRSRLASNQRTRLDQYISSIDAIRGEMTSVADTTDVCIVPPQPAATPENAWNEFSNYEGIADGQISMMAHALACDVTRVGLLQFNRATSKVDFNHVLDHDFAADHHALTHLPGDSNAENDLRVVHDWYDAKFMELLQALEAMTDVDGGPVLDNTVVVRITECMLSNGHEFDEGHHLIAGGGNFLNTPQELTVSNSDSVSKLWLTLAHAVGVELDGVAGHSGDIYTQLLS